MWYDCYFGQMPIDNSKLSASKLAKRKNDQTFQNMFENYFTMAQNLFEWSGLPATCDERFLERCLLLYGKAMIVKQDGSYLSLGAANGAGINIYGYSLKAFGWGMNGFNKQFDVYIPGADIGAAVRKTSAGGDSYPVPEAVICYDNVDWYPYVNYIYDTAARLADLLRSCDVAVANLKSPFVVTCDESNLNSVKEAFKRRDENMATIITSSSINLDSFKVWPTNADPETLKCFWEQFRNVESMLMEILGINSNDNTDKKERLLVDEINSNNEEASINLMKRLRQREIFCERVNDCFPDLNISVKLRKELKTDETANPDGVPANDTAGDLVRGE